MAIDLESIFGKENLTVDARGFVISLLKSMPMQQISRRFLYAQWLRRVGDEPRPGELDDVGAL